MWKSWVEVRLIPAAFSADLIDGCCLFVNILVAELNLAVTELHRIELLQCRSYLAFLWRVVFAAMVKEVYD